MYCRRQKNLNEPVLIHVITKKGKGYRNAEQNPGKFHGIGSFDPETGKEAAKSEKPTYSKVMGEYLTELAKKIRALWQSPRQWERRQGLEDLPKSFRSAFLTSALPSSTL